MSAFTPAHRFQLLYQWIAGNVAGDCSVLVDSPRLGRVVYLCRPPAPGLSIWRRLYGPVAAAGGAQ